MKKEKMACRCRRVTYGMVADAVKKGARSYEDAQEMLGFGRGCGRCNEFIEFLVCDLNKEMLR